LSGFIIGLDGDEKTGKTTLALTFPKPICIFTFDKGGFERAACDLDGSPLPQFRELMETHQIYNYDLTLPMQAQGVETALGALKARLPGQGTNLAQVREAVSNVGQVVKQSNMVIGTKELWYEFLQNLVFVLEGHFPDGTPGLNAKTIVFDSGTQLWNICHRSVLQEKQERAQGQNSWRESLISIEYAEPNSRMSAIIHAARDAGVNLVYINYVRDKYGKILDDRGRLVDSIVGVERDAWSRFGREADLAIETRLEDIAGDKKVTHGKVTISGLDLNAYGMDHDWPTWWKFYRMIHMSRTGEMLPEEEPTDSTN